MGIINDIYSGTIGTVVKEVGEVADKLFTSDAERLQFANELKKIEVDASLKLEELNQRYEEELTKRLQADMGSDSWLAKNIRPLTLIFILVMYSLLSISSGFEFKVTQAYIELLGQWGMLIMSFYFGGRTLEKITTVVKGK